ncbi:hypothetical protein UY3_02781 [Chelonia mydas]|uniref:Uncharacterized protein n=1 Tax=Chelonia mydas TaxID=8469 RepID=M7C663_CHEMY|nr:hypothetical protein UY3_02781 [Chelonia mydas]
MQNYFSQTHEEELLDMYSLCQKKGEAGDQIENQVSVSDVNVAGTVVCNILSKGPDDPLGSLDFRNSFSAPKDGLNLTHTEVQPIVAPTGRGSPLQANGGCRKGGQHVPWPTPLPAAPIGLEQQTEASGSCNQPNLKSRQPRRCMGSTLARRSCQAAWLVPAHLPGFPISLPCCSERPVCPELGILSCDPLRHSDRGQQESE